LSVQSKPWADANNAPWNHYFNYASLNRVTQHLRDGKVSPWLVLNCKSGKEMMSKMSDEQLQLVYHVMDPQHWALRFKRSPADVELVKEIAEKARL
jgi:uroporphyrinogen-III decarboxylase